MKKQYIFLIMLFLILYIWYLILSFTYREYKINSHIEYITMLNKNIKDKINEWEKIIQYKSSLAYKNKVLKEQQSFKNKWEIVIYLTSEKKYNKFTTINKIEINNNNSINKNIINNHLSIYEKWQSIIFKK